ncbi:MAG TPA: hypothetical protein VIG90_09260 [Pedomonas sp.]|uniref:hypothetical protein n=1 Tax=Pedomonas sp. TaxID=2976421 RepID=UPI002F41B5D8
MADTSSGAQLSAPKAALITAAVLVVVAILIGIYMLLDITPLFAGFLFALYWAGIKHTDFKEFAPALVGGLGGLALAAGLHHLPQLYGNAGLAAALVVVVLAIYAQIRNSVPLLVNASFMLYLTVGTIPAVGAQEDYPGMAFALIVGAAYCGGLVWLMGRLAGAKAQTAAPQTDTSLG